MELCAKGYHNRFRNCQEKGAQTNRKTNRHFRMYNSRDIRISMYNTYTNTLYTRYNTLKFINIYPWRKL